MNKIWTTSQVFHGKKYDVKLAILLNSDMAHPDLDDQGALQLGEYTGNSQLYLYILVNF